MDPLKITQLKEETLLWIFSILGAVLVYIIVANIANAMYHPDIAGLKNIANKLLAEPDYARPEPMEALLFRLGIITIIPSLLGFYIILSKTRLVSYLAKEPLYLSISILVIALILILVYVDFAALNPYGYWEWRSTSEWT